MLQFRDYLPEAKEPLDISEEEIDKMISDLQWKDIEDLYDEDEFVKEELQEAISASERLKMAQRTRARKAMLAISRKIKLKRPSAMSVLKRRSQLAARKMIYKKVLRGRDKTQLSPSEKDMAELRVKRILSTYKTLPQRLMPKIREIERTRLARQA